MAVVRDVAGPFAIARPYTIALITPGWRHAGALRSELAGALPATADRWLWQLASRSTPGDFRWHPETAANQLRVLCASRRTGVRWCCGTAPPSSVTALILARATSTSSGHCIPVLSTWTRCCSVPCSVTTSTGSPTSSPGCLTRPVSAPGRHVGEEHRAVPEHVLAPHLTAHGPANVLLLAFQDQYRLPERFSEILAEAADYSRLVQGRESLQISGALGILTILGLPLGTALGILQVLGDESSPTFWSLSVYRSPLPRVCSPHGTGSSCHHCVAEATRSHLGFRRYTARGASSRSAGVDGVARLRL